VNAKQVCNVELTPTGEAKVRKYKRLYPRIVKQLKSAMPNADDKLLSRLAIDLADLDEVARAHKAAMGDLLRMKFPRDFDKFFDFMCLHVSVELAFHADWHIRSLKRSENPLSAALNHAERTLRSKTRRTKRK
jgi:hypothetical protein